MTAVETPEQALRRISTGCWIVFVLEDGWRGDGISPVEHVLRTSQHKATRCSLTVVGKNVAPALGNRPPCRSCLRSIEADAAMRIPIPAPVSALAAAQLRADRFREATRALAGMLVDAKVHPETIKAVLVEAAPEVALEVISRWL